ncbi:helix-turn-helix domain-containing protein [Bifidobacterium asteroides]|uniref:helix-turn-helix domain-containing protein n=1 Tax=Bifidobacterium asteroides TaxID=1684 RepID=UPI003558DCE8
MSQKIQPSKQGIHAPSGRRSGEEIRSAILDHLHTAAEQTGAGLTAQQIGAAFGIHPTTARFHLERLVEQGDAVRHTRDREGRSAGRGRPSVIYSPIFTNHAREDMISSLCLALETACPDADSRGRAALKAGQVWGRTLARQSGANAEKDVASSMSQTLLNTLATLGFAPVMAEPDSSSLFLTACPSWTVSTPIPLSARSIWGWSKESWKAAAKRPGIKEPVYRWNLCHRQKDAS